MLVVSSKLLTMPQNVYSTQINSISGNLKLLCRIPNFRSILQNRKQGVAPGWYLYYLCGVLGTLEHLGKDEHVCLIQICVDGRVPPRAGLSSSSALVCAAALATLVAYDVSTFAYFKPLLT